MSAVITSPCLPTHLGAPAACLRVSHVNSHTVLVMHVVMMLGGGRVHVDLVC